MGMIYRPGVSPTNNPVQYYLANVISWTASTVTFQNPTGTGNLTLNHYLGSASYAQATSVLAVGNGSPQDIVLGAWPPLLGYVQPCVFGNGWVTPVADSAGNIGVLLSTTSTAPTGNASYNSTGLSGASAQDFVLLQISSSGSINWWTKIETGLNVAVSTNNGTAKICNDPAGNLYVIGSIPATRFWNAGLGSSTGVSGTYGKVFSYSSTGTYQWYKDLNPVGSSQWMALHANNGILSIAVQSNPGAGGYGIGGVTPTGAGSLSQSAAGIAILNATTGAIISVMLSPATNGGNNTSLKVSVLSNGNSVLTGYNNIGATTLGGTSSITGNYFWIMVFNSTGTCIGTSYYPYQLSTTSYWTSTTDYAGNVAIVVKQISAGTFTWGGRSVTLAAGGAAYFVLSYSLTPIYSSNISALPSGITQTCLDTAMSLYFIGTFSGTLTLGAYSVTATNGTSGDIYAACFVAGSYSWLARAGSSTGSNNLQQTCLNVSSGMLAILWGDTGTTAPTFTPSGPSPGLQAGYFQSLQGGTWG